MGNQALCLMYMERLVSQIKWVRRLKDSRWDTTHNKANSIHINNGNLLRTWDMDIPHHRWGMVSLPRVSTDSPQDILNNLNTLDNRYINNTQANTHRMLNNQHRAQCLNSNLLLQLLRLIHSLPWVGLHGAQLVASRLPQ